jgi:hypothetical protein
MVNSSRSLQTLGEQSSVYIPMSNRPAKLPSYLLLNAASPWHIAALQIIGVESMTLSSRLRTPVGGRGTLQDLEDTINSTGKRRIAKFEMSIADPDVLSDNIPQEDGQVEKTGLMTPRHTSKGDEQLGIELRLDEGRKNMSLVERRFLGGFGPRRKILPRMTHTTGSIMGRPCKGMFIACLGWVFPRIRSTQCALKFWRSRSTQHTNKARHQSHAMLSEYKTTNSC